MSSFISQDSLQQTKATDSSWQPVLPPPSRSLSLLSNFSQTYQQSSSLQSKNRKKNKGKREIHLFSCTSCHRVSRNCYHSHMLASCGHSLLHFLGDAELMRVARIMRAYAASVEPSILLTLCVCNVSWIVYWLDLVCNYWIFLKEMLHLYVNIVLLFKIVSIFTVCSLEDRFHILLVLTFCAVKTMW